jgi:hypothetical protein
VRKAPFQGHRGEQDDFYSIEQARDLERPWSRLLFALPDQCVDRDDRIRFEYCAARVTSAASAALLHNLICRIGRWRAAALAALRRRQSALNVRQADALES